MNKKQYIAPQMELETLDMIELVATSTLMGIHTDKDKDASGALANPFRKGGFEDFGGF